MFYRCLFLVFVFGVFLLPTANAQDVERRVWYMPDGSVKVTVPAMKSCRPVETRAQCLNRIYEDSAEGRSDLTQALQSGQYDDITVSDFPPPEVGEFWKGSKGAGVSVDERAKSKDAQDRADEESNRVSVRLKLKELGLTDREIDRLFGK
ncbi:MAG: hypothetical protein J3T61_00445 [Candidatus Brocadiales bacterium]|nr:hypothetical protein [Candidatus Bathyanammoxibius sp.]